MTNNIKLGALISLLALISCWSKKPGSNIKFSYDDTVKINGKPYFQSNKHDSVIKAIEKEDTLYVQFETGFNKTNLKIFDNNNLIITKLITSINGFADYYPLNKKDNKFSFQIDSGDFSIPIYRKYRYLLVNYDSLNKKVFVDYSNSIPIRF